ncbi:MAG: DUF4282 domain-containing protein [Dehalococcoidia bacterium]|jgi:hypothetical protein
MNFFSFEKMIAPSIIKAIFGVLVVLCLLAALIGFIAGLVNDQAGLALLLLVAYGAVAPLLLRIYFEFVLVLFCINDKLDRLLQK